jgi:hypothetical protein
LRWWWTSAALGVVGTVFLVVVFFMADPTNALFAWFGCWLVAVVAMVPAYRLGWVQRHDRYDDELCRYAAGTRAEMSLRSGDGVVHLGGAVVGTSTADDEDRRTVETDVGELVLEERVLAGAEDGGVRTVAVRLVVAGEDTALASARGERRGDRVDWTLELPLGELRLRQALEAVPSRRTLLDADGRAWRIRADVDAPAWSAELPGRADALDAVFVTWLACHLDAVGLARCYHLGFGSGPALTVPDGRGVPVNGTPWRRVGTPGARPEVPMASAQTIDI